MHAAQSSRQFIHIQIHIHTYVKIEHTRDLHMFVRILLPIRNIVDGPETGKDGAELTKRG